MAIRIDEVNVVGFTAWSLMDNFEWGKGYKERFGLFHTSFNRQDKMRTMKASGYFYQKLAKANGFPSETEIRSWREDSFKYCHGLQIFDQIFFNW
jgi:beta-glucosidase/6-phospho-beta-glucosidase/beta-galactosidase